MILNTSWKVKTFHDGFIKTILEKGIILRQFLTKNHFKIVPF